MKKSVIISVVSLLFCLNSLSALIVSRVHLNNTNNNEIYYINARPGDTVIMYKPPIAQHNITWVTPDYQYLYNQDTAIVTYALQGDWIFSSNEVGKDVYIFFVTYPNLGPDRNFCSGTSTVLNPHCSNVTYLWSTNQTTPTITVSNTGTYWVRVQDLLIGYTAYDTITVTKVFPTSAPICYVGNDILLNKNRINWINLPPNADSVRIYRESLRIGSVYKNTNSFQDPTGNPSLQAYSYTIGIVDTCGNESSLSSLHRTMLFAGSYTYNTYSFSWSPYQGITVTTYTIYGIDSNMNVVLIGSVPGNQYTYEYLNPNPIYTKYFVGFESTNCGSNLVKSNTIQSVGVGVDERISTPFVIYPNPATDECTILVNAKHFEIQFINMFGQVCLTGYDQKEIDIRTLQAGTYIVRMIINDAISYQKMLVQ